MLVRVCDPKRRVFKSLTCKLLSCFFGISRRLEDVAFRVADPHEHLTFRRLGCGVQYADSQYTFFLLAGNYYPIEPRIPGALIIGNAVSFSHSRNTRYGQARQISRSNFL